MLTEMKQLKRFDWGWSRWLRSQAIPQYAAKDSLVMHVRMHGTWGKASTKEKSVGFDESRLADNIKERVHQYMSGQKPLR